MYIGRSDKEKSKSWKYLFESGEFATRSPKTAAARRRIPEELSRSKKSRKGANRFLAVAIARLLFYQRHCSREAFGEAICLVSIELNY